MSDRAAVALLSVKVIYAKPIFDAPIHRLIFLTFAKAHIKNRGTRNVDIKHAPLAISDK